MDNNGYEMSNNLCSGSRIFFKWMLKVSAWVQELDFYYQKKKKKSIQGVSYVEVL